GQNGIFCRKNARKERQLARVGAFALSVNPKGRELETENRLAVPDSLRTLWPGKTALFSSGCPSTRCGSERERKGAITNAFLQLWERKGAKRSNRQRSFAAAGRQKERKRA